MSLGLELRRLREAAGLSQSQLADRAGITQATVSRFESGQRQFQELAAESLFRLADALGVPVEHFRPFMFPDAMPAPSPPQLMGAGGAGTITSKRK